jgi:hypothetical protein
VLGQRVGAEEIEWRLPGEVKFEGLESEKQVEIFVKNVSSVPHTIKLLQASCSCVKLAPGVLELAPGAESKFAGIVVKTRNAFEVKNVHVDIVFTIDDSAAVVQKTLTMTSAFPLLISPKSLTFKDAADQVQTISISSTEQKVKLGVVAMNCDVCRVEALKPDKHGAAMEIVLSPIVPSGSGFLRMEALFEGKLVPITIPITVGTKDAKEVRTLLEGFRIKFDR